MGVLQRTLWESVWQIQVQVSSSERETDVGTISYFEARIQTARVASQKAKGGSRRVQSTKKNFNVYIFQFCTSTVVKEWLKILRLLIRWMFYEAGVRTARGSCAGGNVTWMISWKSDVRRYNRERNKSQSRFDQEVAVNKAEGECSKIENVSTDVHTVCFLLKVISDRFQQWKNISCVVGLRDESEKIWSGLSAGNGTFICHQLVEKSCLQPPLPKSAIRKCFESVLKATMHTTQSDN